jgi:hypothetical protein
MDKNPHLAPPNMRPKEEEEELSYLRLRDYLLATN